MDSHPDAGGLGVKMIDGKGNFLPESKRGLPTPWVAFYKMFGLSKSVIESIKSVFTLFPEIEQVIIFGSRAKGNYTTGSDIDLTLVGKDLSLNLLNDVSLRLDDLELIYSFDVSIFSKLRNKELISHIDRVGILFYEK